MQDFIIKLLDLKEEDIDSIHTVSKINQADFLIILKVKYHVCPQCGCFTRYVKDYRTRKLKHKVLVNFSSTIFYRQRRYLCRNCQKSFVEKSPFTGNRHTMTPATVINILNAHMTETYVVERIRKISPMLDDAYKIKEEFVSINDETAESFNGKDKKEKELNSLIKKMMISEIPEMIECAKTLKNRKKEILNSFVWVENRRLSNEPVEGKNNHIKKIINNANGMQNFERARNKFIYSQNLYEGYTVSEHTKKSEELEIQEETIKKQRSMMTARIHCPHTFKLKVG